MLTILLGLEVYSLLGSWALGLLLSLPRTLLSFLWRRLLSFTDWRRSQALRSIAGHMYARHLESCAMEFGAESLARPASLRLLLQKDRVS